MFTQNVLNVFQNNLLHDTISLTKFNRVVLIGIVVKILIPFQLHLL